MGFNCLKAIERLPGGRIVSFVPSMVVISCGVLFGLVSYRFLQTPGFLKENEQGFLVTP